MDTHSLNKLIINIQQAILKATAALRDNGLEKTPAHKELGALYKKISVLNPIEDSLNLKRDKPTPKDKPNPQAQTIKQEDVSVSASASPSVMSKAAELAKKTKTNVSIVETMTVGEIKKLLRNI